MRILYIPGYSLPSRKYPFANGGDVRYSQAFILALLCLGHEVIVIDRRKLNEDAGVREFLLSQQILKSASQPETRLKISNYFGRLSSCAPSFDISVKRARLVKRLSKDVDLVITNTPLSLELFFLKSLPLVYNASGLTDVRNYGHTWKEIRDKIVIKVLREPLRRLTWRRSVFVNTTSTAESALLRQLGASAMKIISIPSCSILPRPEKAQEAMIGSQLGVSDRLKVLHVGRLSPAKNQINILKQLGTNPNIELTLVGISHSHDPNYSDRLREMLSLEEYDGVRYLESISDDALALEYQRADVVVVMSKGYDPLPTVIYEAMSFGCPIVSTDMLTRQHFGSRNPSFHSVIENDFEKVISILLEYHEDRNLLESHSRIAQVESSNYSFEVFSSNIKDQLAQFDRLS